MKAIVVAALLVLSVACGQVSGRPSTALISPGASPSTQPSPTSQPSPMVTPKTSPTLLFAVLEAKGTANSSTYNTVAIASLDGYARAKATFTPMPVPSLGCMGAVLPASAHVAAGRVFFADAKGVIRSLAPDGKVATVTTFPMTSSQQTLSFAVSPDGTKLLATIFTSPKNAFSCNGSPSSGTFTFEAYASNSGGPSRLLYHESWTKPQDVLALTGWDSTGPFGTYPTVWASQGGGPGSTLGVFVRIDAATLKPSNQFSDPSKCQVWDSVATGSFVCLQDPVMKNGGTSQQTVEVPVSVRRADGTELWHFTATGQNSPFGPYLSADAQHVLICCNDLNLADSHERLVGRDGTQRNLATGFYVSGWLDPTTVVGWTSSSLAYVALNAPSTAVSMGFSGLFVGTVRS